MITSWLRKKPAAVVLCEVLRETAGGGADVNIGEFEFRLLGQEGTQGHYDQDFTPISNPTIASGIRGLTLEFIGAPRRQGAAQPCGDQELEKRP